MNGAPKTVQTEKTRNMPKTLYLITNVFPFGTWEPYLETELNYYGPFKQVRIFSLSVRKEQAKHCRIAENERLKIYPIYFLPKLLYVWWGLAVLFDRNFYAELRDLSRQKKLSLRRLYALFVYFSRAHYEAGRIWCYLKQDGAMEQDQAILIYAYRFAYQTYIAYLLKKRMGKGQIVARAHGSDLYEELAPSGHQPLRTFLLDQIQALYLVSQFGYDYILNKYPAWSAKFQLARLGTADHGTAQPHQREPYELVTCSALVPLKRIARLIDALALIDGHQIRWTHYGEGPLQADLEKQAQRLLQAKANIDYCFRGFVDNQSVLSEYKAKQVFLLINVSTSEGVPVSIMEAQSLGIPVIATAVGGNAEIVKDQINGRLLDEHFSDTDLKAAIVYFIAMPEADYQNYRRQARALWQKNYAAAPNYELFVQSLMEL